MLTGNRITGSKICPSATSSTTNLTLTILGLNLVLRIERAATVRLNHVTDFEKLCSCILCIKIEFLPYREHTSSPLQRAAG